VQGAGEGSETGVHTSIIESQGKFLRRIAVENIAVVPIWHSGRLGVQQW